MSQNLVYRAIRWVLAAAAFTLLLSAGVWPNKKDENANIRTVQGVVSNAQGEAVNGAVVQLKNTKSLQIRSFITSDDGSYHFVGLGTDVEYQLKAFHDGVNSSWKTLSVFNSKKTAIINLKLKK